MSIKTFSGLSLLGITVFCVCLAMSKANVPVKDGTQIGQHAPTFTLKNQDDQDVSLATLLKKDPVVLVFIRSADWCPACKLRMIQLERNLAEIQAAGGQVVGISFDSTKVLKAFSDRKQITFPLLSDVASKTIEAYGMRNQVSTDGSSIHGIVILDQNGVIRSKLFPTTHEDGELVSELTHALKAARNVNGETK